LGPFLNVSLYEEKEREQIQRSLALLKKKQNNTAENSLTRGLSGNNRRSKLMACNKHKYIKGINNLKTPQPNLRL